MWFAALKRQTKGTFKTGYVVPAIPTEDDFRLYVFTYSVGHFALQVVGAKWTRDDPKRLTFPFIEQHPRYSAVSTPFWPIDNKTTFAWPPPDYLPENSIDEFASRWGRLNLVK